MKSRAELYLEHIEELADAEPLFWLFGPEDGPLPPVTSIIYRDRPEAGLLTAFTYGLSLADHPDWKFGAPELVLCVQSEDLAWGWAIAQAAARLRGDCPFSIGNTIRFHEQIAPESTMSAFLVFFPTVLDREAATVKLPDRTVHIVGMYPIYEGEVDLVNRIGPAAFWDLEAYDPHDVGRPDLSLGF
jgi:hypothetical protein